MGIRKIKRNSESLDESFLPSKRLRSKKKRNTASAVNRKARIFPKLNRNTIFYSLFGVVLFLMIFLAKVPLDRFGGTILVELSKATQMDWDASEVQLSFLLGPRIVFKDLVLKPRAEIRRIGGRSSKLEQMIQTYGITFSEFSFRPSLIQLLLSAFQKDAVPGGSFSGEAYGSSVSGSFSMIKKLEAEFEVENLSLSKVDFLQKVSRIKGTIQELEISVSAQRARLGNANGSVQLTAAGLEFNPGAFVNDGFVRSLGDLNLGDLALTSTAKNGRLDLERFSLKGKNSDLEADLTGDLRLDDSVPRTKMNLVLRLNPREKLRPILNNPLLLTIFAKEASGSFATKLDGTFAAPLPKPYKSGT